MSEDNGLSGREFLEKVTLAEVHEEERLTKVKTKEADIAAMLTCKKSGASSGSTLKNSSASAKKCAAEAAEPPPVPPEMKEYLKSMSSLTAKIDQLTTQSASQFNRLKSLENMISNQNIGKNTGQQSGMGNPVSGNQNNRAGSGNNSDGSGSGNQTGRRIFKCKDCVAKNIGYCHHCFKCNGDDHKAKDCTKN